jgi:hypothetical protein
LSAALAAFGASSLAWSTQKDPPPETLKGHPPLPLPLPHKLMQIHQTSPLLPHQPMKTAAVADAVAASTTSAASAAPSAAVDGTTKRDQQLTQQPPPLDGGRYSSDDKNSDDLDEEPEVEVEAKKPASV